MTTTVYRFPLQLVLSLLQPAGLRGILSLSLSHGCVAFNSKGCIDILTGGAVKPTGVAVNDYCENAMDVKLNQHYLGFYFISTLPRFLFLFCSLLSDSLLAIVNTKDAKGEGMRCGGVSLCFHLPALPLPRGVSVHMYYTRLWNLHRACGSRSRAQASVCLLLPATRTRPSILRF